MPVDWGTNSERNGGNLQFPNFRIERNFTWKTSWDSKRIRNEWKHPRLVERISVRNSTESDQKFEWKLADGIRSHSARNWSETQENIHRESSSGNLVRSSVETPVGKLAGNSTINEPENPVPNSQIQSEIQLDICGSKRKFLMINSWKNLTRNSWKNSAKHSRKNSAGLSHFKNGRLEIGLEIHSKKQPHWTKSPAKMDGKAAEIESRHPSHVTAWKPADQLVCLATNSTQII